MTTTSLDTLIQRLPTGGNLPVLTARIEQISGVCESVNAGSPVPIARALVGRAEGGEA